MTTSSTGKFASLNTNAEAPAIKPQHLLVLCKASADPLRLDILRVLNRDSFGVLELCLILACKQSSMSHHLKILANAGLVTTRREGNSIFYRRPYKAIDSSLNELQQSLYSAVDKKEVCASMQARISTVQQERSENSRAFFSLNADKFSQQQEQVVAYELYGANTIELISSSLVDERDSVLEVGPGEGAFLAELAPRFKQVYALDNSQQMLNKAQQFADQHGLANVSFICGDTKHKKLASLNMDCVVVNMVLHHTPSPADIFFDLATTLKKNGQLFITDLCSHDQTWARDACGDLWLGFEPQDLSQWAAQAGFKTGESIYLTQRNGFRVQIRQFIKL
ncbi:MAG: metalloregulator ArsR/SmtB family transcription factor [Spongiibacteraceae bacterium]|nr:metalloregulator ArsR/SmtB family transcription factor [Spongiibacteraceae bacterium]